MSESPATDPLVAGFRQQYREVAARLDQATASAEREAVKREIIAFFKRVDTALTEIGQVKEEIRALVDRYKQMATTTDTALRHRSSPGRDR